MKSNNNSEQKRDDDLIFTPLNIKEPFKPNNSLFLSPLNTDELYFSNSRNNIFAGYPPYMLNEYNILNDNTRAHAPEKVGHFGDISGIVGEIYGTSKDTLKPGTSTTMPGTDTTTPSTSPIPPGVSTTTPGTTMTPGVGTTTPGITMAPGVGTTIPGTPPMTSGVGTTTPGTTMTPGIGTITPSTLPPGVSNTTAFPSPTPNVPLMPYPSSIPSLELDDLNTLNNLTPTSGMTESSQETDSDDLYSYNVPEHSINTTATTHDTINAVDILRNFDYSYDYNSYDNRNDISSKDVDKIFEEIEKNHPGILATMKAYRVPYPISKVLIKKIIYITTKYINK